MKSQRTSLLMSCLLFSTMFSFSAMAEKSSPICVNASSEVCKDSPYSKNLKIGRELVKKEISDEAKRTSAPRIAQMEKEISRVNVIKRMSAKNKIVREETLKAIKKTFGDLDPIANNQDAIEKIKGYLYEAIDNSSFTSGTKSALQARVRSVHIESYTSLLNYTERTNNEKVRMNLDGTCGYEGLRDNAFALTIDENGAKRNIVLMCPGLLVNLKLLNSEKDRFNYILQTLTHELSHHIDPSHFAEGSIYTKYMACVAKNMKDKIKKSAGGYANEMVADEWATQVLELHARREAMSVDSATKFITTAFYGYCGTYDEGIHPAPEYRILKTVINPEMSDILNCKNPVRNVTCGFEGEVPLR